MKKVKVRLISAPADAVNNTLISKKIRPNDLCPCGSGLKAKKCCGVKTTYSYNKIVKRVIPEENVPENIQQKYCFEVGDNVILKDTCPNEDIRGKAAVVVMRGIEYTSSGPYYVVRINGESEPYKWVIEELLSHYITL